MLTIKLKQTLLFALMLGFSTSSNAAFGDIKDSWHIYLLLMTLVSAIGGFYCVKRKQNIQTTGIKILVGGIYFWVIMFTQLIVFALAYQLLT